MKYLIFNDINNSRIMINPGVIARVIGTKKKIKIHSHCKRLDSFETPIVLKYASNKEMRKGMADLQEAMSFEVLG